MSFNYQINSLRKILLTVTTSIDNFKTENVIDKVELHCSDFIDYSGKLQDISLTPLPVDNNKPTESLWKSEITTTNYPKEIYCSIEVTDSIGNKAVAIPEIVTTFPPKENELFLLSSDEDKILSFFDSSLNILEIKVGMDKENIYFKIITADNIRFRRGQKFANIYGIGFIYPDVSKEPARWKHEFNYAKIIIYAPLLSKIGFFPSLSNFLIDKGKKIRYRIVGNILYISCQKSYIISDKDFSKGIKTFAATAVVNTMSLTAPEPVDFTNYVLIYSGDKKLTIKD